MTERIQKAFDSGDSTISVFLDLHKAFDSVDHCILIQKFDAAGVRGNALGLLVSYLHQIKFGSSVLRQLSTTESVQSFSLKVLVGSYPIQYSQSSPSSWPLSLYLTFKYQL